jgi:hypothetical protein
VSTSGSGRSLDWPWPSRRTARAAALGDLAAQTASRDDVAAYALLTGEGITGVDAVPALVEMARRADGPGQARQRFEQAWSAAEGIEDADTRWYASSLVLPLLDAVEITEERAREVVASAHAIARAADRTFGGAVQQEELIALLAGVGRVADAGRLMETLRAGYDRESASVPIIRALAASGAVARADGLARRLENEAIRSQAWIAMAEIAADDRDEARVLDLYHRIDLGDRRPYFSPDEQRAIVGALARAGRPEEAERLVARFAKDAQDLSGASGLWIAAMLGTSLGTVLAAAGSPGRAMRLVEPHLQDAWRYRGFDDFAGALAEAAGRDEAQRFLSRIEAREGRARALALLARLALSADDLAGARRLVAAAELAARTTAHASAQESGLAVLAGSLAARGDLPRAFTVARSILGHRDRAAALSALLRGAAASANTVDSISLIITEVEHCVSRESRSSTRVSIRTELLSALAASGADPRAMIDLALAVPNPRERIEVIGHLAEAIDLPAEAVPAVLEAAVAAGADAVAAGDVYSGDPGDGSRKLRIYRILFPLLLRYGRVAAAGTFVAKTRGTGQWALAHDALVRSLVDRGLFDEALCQAEELPADEQDAPSNYLGRIPGVRLVAEGLAEAGRVEDAEALLDRIDAGPDRDNVLLVVSSGLTTTGDTTGAERSIAAIQDPRLRVRALSRMAAAVPARSDAVRLLDRAEAEAAPDVGDRVDFLAPIVTAAAAWHEVDRVCALLPRLSEWELEYVLRDLLGADDGAINHELTDRYLDAATPLVAAGHDQDPSSQQQRITLARQLVRRGRESEAEKLLRPILTDLFWGPEPIRILATAAAAGGDLARARDLVRRGNGRTERAGLLVELADTVRDRDPRAAADLLADAVVEEIWVRPLAALGELEPGASARIADEYRLLWGGAAP